MRTSGPSARAGAACRKGTASSGPGSRGAVHAKASGNGPEAPPKWRCAARKVAQAAPEMTCSGNRGKAMPRRRRAEEQTVAPGPTAPRARSTAGRCAEAYGVAAARPGQPGAAAGAARRARRGEARVGAGGQGRRRIAHGVRGPGQKGVAGETAPSRQHAQEDDVSVAAQGRTVSRRASAGKSAGMATAMCTRARSEDGAGG